MPRLHAYFQARDIIAAFRRAGFVEIPGRGRGSHTCMRNPVLPRVLLTIPDHNPVKPGTLRSLIREAGMSVEEFVELL